jgi:hypothetical protein
MYDLTLNMRYIFELKYKLSCDHAEVSLILFSHFWDRPVPIFSDVRFSYLALVQDK